MVGTMIEQTPFGRTGHRSSRVIFGAAALGAMSQDRADTTLAQAVEAGVNHIDTAFSYGESEVRLAPFLADHRADVFLATKTEERSGEGARAGLENSLRRLGVDAVDLIQLHNLVEEDEWRQAFSPGGAVDALARARDEGLCRFIGVTGHGLRIPAMHLRSLAEFDFDSVLFPYNHSLLTITAYRDDVEQLIAQAVQRNVALQTIKSIARGRWPSPPDEAFSWYEPLTDEGAITRAVHFVLGRNELFLNSTSDTRLLPLVYRAAGSMADAGHGSVAIDPDAETLAADRDRFGIHPLFDGNELERI
jgi:aryl-alcohol dehydrogenase-like predicted oxidoreductase